MRAIESVGAYVPRQRITAEEIGDAWDGFRARGVEGKRVAGADEDAVTMAVAALRDAIADAGPDRASFETLAVGTTTPPVDEGGVGVTVAEILGLADDVEVIVHSQSTRAGTRALLSAVRADGPALAVAADCPRGDPDDAIDHAAGAGAVAVATGEQRSSGPGTPSESGRARVAETATWAREYPGTRYRERGADAVETYGATAYEREAYTTAVEGAVGRLSEVPAALAPTAPDGSLPGRAGGVVDATVYHLAGELGDTGAASPLFGLLAAWDAGESTVAVVGYGDGADAVLVEGCSSVDWERPAVEVTYAEYLRKRGHIVSDGGDR